MNTTRRAKKYSTTEVNRLLEQHVARIRELAAENKSLAAQVTGLLRQLADADEALLKIDADTRRLGRAVREFVEVPECDGIAGARRLHPSTASTGDEPQVTPPARLRLVPLTVSTEGEQ